MGVRFQFAGPILQLEKAKAIADSAKKETAGAWQITLKFPDAIPPSSKRAV